MGAMSGRARALLLALAPVVLASCTPAPPPPTLAASPKCLAGMYNGGQMELAAALELNGNGSFRYALSYGALDEETQGSWRFTDGAVRLTSDAKGPGMGVFADTALLYDKGNLLLDRHGRALRFRRMGPECSTKQ